MSNSKPREQEKMTDKQRSNRPHEDNCGRTGKAGCASCKLDCACWCHKTSDEQRVKEPIEIPCPHCQATTGQKCFESRFGLYRHTFHNARIDAASRLSKATIEPGLCDVCKQPLEFPADDDPAFVGDTAVTSKCRHTIRMRDAEAAPEAVKIDWQAVYSGEKARDANMEVARLTCKRCGGLQENCTCPSVEEAEPAPQTFEHPRADCEGCGDPNCFCNLVDADGFLEWWRDNNQSFEASDSFTHPIDYAAAAWNAAKASCPSQKLLGEIIDGGYLDEHPEEKKRVVSLRTSSPSSNRRR